VLLIRRYQRSEKLIASIFREEETIIRKKAGANMMDKGKGLQYELTELAGSSESLVYLPNCTASYYRRL
jgi:hypothetical protein